MIENPPAFPPSITTTAAGGVYHGYDGMSLRDYFAGQALAVCGAVGSVRRKGFETQAEADARYCYERADAMLAARNQGEQS